MCRNRSSVCERGGSRLNLLIWIVIIGAVAYVGYQYVPVAFRASTYKVYMQDTVDRGLATGQGISWVENQLRAGADNYGVPDSAVYKIEQRDGRIVANVHWTRPIPLPGYIYQYNFDHTVRSSGFFTSK
jgi:hypothetical protein